MVRLLIGSLTVDQIDEDRNIGRVDVDKKSFFIERQYGHVVRFSTDSKSKESSMVVALLTENSGTTDSSGVFRTG